MTKPTGRPRGRPRKGSKDWETETAEKLEKIAEKILSSTTTEKLRDANISELSRILKETGSLRNLLRGKSQFNVAIKTQGDAEAVLPGSLSQLAGALRGLPPGARAVIAGELLKALGLPAPMIEEAKSTFLPKAQVINEGELT